MVLLGKEENSDVHDNIVYYKPDHKLTVDDIPTKEDIGKPKSAKPKSIPAKVPKSKPAKAPASKPKAAPKAPVKVHVPEKKYKTLGESNCTSQVNVPLETSLFVTPSLYAVPADPFGVD